MKISGSEILSKLLQCTNDEEVIDTLDTYASEDLTKILPAITLYAAASSQFYSFGSTEYLAAGYNGQVHDNVQEWKIYSWLKAKMGPEVHLSKQVSDLSSLLFYGSYDDWWDLEVFEEDEEEELATRIWFNLSDLAHTVPIISSIGHLILAQDSIFALMKLSFDEFLAADVLDLAKRIGGIVVHPDLQKAQLETVQLVGNLFLERDSHHETGLELLCLYHTRATDANWEKARAYWESLASAKSKSLILVFCLLYSLNDQNLEKALAAYDGLEKHIYDEKALFKEMMRRYNSENAPLLAEFSKAFCQRYPDNLYLNTFYANHMKSEEEKRERMLKVLQLLPQDFYLSMGSEGHYHINMKDDFSAYGVEGVIRNHLEAVASLNPSQEFAQKVLKILRRYKREWGTDEELKQWEAALKKRIVEYTE